MAVNLRKRKARRRLAAVAFLSSITLDGPGQETSLGSILKCEQSQSGNEVRRKNLYQRRLRQEGKLGHTDKASPSRESPKQTGEKYIPDPNHDSA